MKKILVFNEFPDVIGGTFRIFDESAEIPGNEANLEILIYPELEMFIELGIDVIIATPDDNKEGWEKNARTAIGRARTEECEVDAVELQAWRDFFSL